MKEMIFSGLLIVAGAILVAVYSSDVGVGIGLALIAWGIVERFYSVWKRKRKASKSEEQHSDSAK